MLDAHQHFWRVDRGDYDWLGPHLQPLNRDFEPADLLPHLSRAGITRTIVVQAAQTEGETVYLLDLAEQHDFIAGVVGWLDMEADDFEHKLDRFATFPKFVGLRPMLQDLPDDAWIVRPRVLDALRVMARKNVPFDILSFPRHLRHVQRALEHTPTLRAVVDHMSKPDIAHQTFEPWKEDMATLAKLPNVFCKLSGLVTEASEHWQYSDFVPYVDHVVESFGAQRLMFGSDWPVCTLRATYAEVANLIRTLLARHFGGDALHDIFEANAARFYGV
ncbi:amidohydrolase family protein [Paraburkholderia youngii]|uniref:Amidohydrolase family protein n=1 Tax=Paraburkholderia youngii TaxID=2782701 RepID=A0ABX2NID8_9BURK|nr:amidohydrolase family protein [Paraburkholderia youngii]NVI03932.1 amidohydrolase family protein [Paraburkholderia youngii]